MSDEVKCKIKLKKKISNNAIKGKVDIVSKNDLIIQQAFIEIAGISFCEWPLDYLVCRVPKLYLQGTTVSGFQQFYYTRHLLCGGEISHHHRDHETYTFLCYWPSRLPGSWVGDYGRVEYYAKVTILLENCDDKYIHSQLIYVRFRRHLNLEEHLLFEGRVDVHRHFTTMKSLGHVNVSVWIPISGIAAGQSLPVLCTVNNHSKLHFGSLVFVLTRIDIYRSDKPISVVKKVRTDVTRVARKVNIHRGRLMYFAVLETSDKIIPTNQFYKLTCCQTVYEVWVSVQGAFKRYNIFGYPNIDTPGIPVVVGTKPIRKFNCFEMTAEVLKHMSQGDGTDGFVEELPEDFRQIITTTEEELSREAVVNLERQLEFNEQATTIAKHNSLSASKSKSELALLNIL